MTKANAIRYLRTLKPTNVTSLKKATAKIRAWAKRAGLKYAKAEGIYSYCWVGRTFVVKVPRSFVLGMCIHRSWAEIVSVMKADAGRRQAFLRNKALAKHIPETAYVNTIFTIQERCDPDKRSPSEYWDSPKSFRTRKVQTMIEKFERLQVRDIHCENVGFRKNRTPVLIDLGTDQNVHHGMIISI